MEASVESRLTALEERMARIEALLIPAPARTAAAEPRPAHAMIPPPPRTEAPPPGRAARRETPNLEELLGGRVLGWVGGSAIVLGVVFFLVMAVSRGWIDEPTRVVLAFLGSTALLAAAIWLHERHGQTQASLAAAAAALAALYASLTVGTVVYDVIPDLAGLVVAALVGAAGAAIAVRWRSQVVAAIGIVGALLAPVLVGAGTSSASLAFMAIALVAAATILVWQRWPWLAAIAFLVSLPQLAAWLFRYDRSHPLGVELAVIGGFWLLWLVCALGHELRVPTDRLRVSSASLLFANAAAVSGLGWLVLDHAHHGAGATAWVLAVAAGHVGVGVAALRGRISGEVGALLVALGTALSALGLALAVSGPVLVTGWAVEAVLLAWVGRRAGDARGGIGAGAFLALALAHLLAFEARPDSLAVGLDRPVTALAAIAVFAVACVGVSRLVTGELAPWRPALEGVAAVAVVYGCSLAIVDAAGANGETTQSGQLLLSAFWSLTGLAALVAGLVRDVRRLRLGGLALLGIAVAKVFLVDLQTLDSIYRVGSFIGVGLLLIAGAFAYQRVRREVQP